MCTLLVLVSTSSVSHCVCVRTMIEGLVASADSTGFIHCRNGRRIDEGVGHEQGGVLLPLDIRDDLHHAFAGGESGSLGWPIAC